MYNYSFESSTEVVDINTLGKVNEYFASQGESDMHLVFNYFRAKTIPATESVQVNLKLDTPISPFWLLDKNRSTCLTNGYNVVLDDTNPQCSVVYSPAFNLLHGRRLRASTSGIIPQTTSFVHSFIAPKVRVNGGDYIEVSAESIYIKKPSVRFNQPSLAYAFESLPGDSESRVLSISVDNINQVDSASQYHPFGDITMEISSVNAQYLKDATNHINCSSDLVSGNQICTVGDGKEIASVQYNINRDAIFTVGAPTIDFVFNPTNLLDGDWVAYLGDYGYNIESTTTQ